MSGYRQFHGLTASAFGKAIGRSDLLLYPHLTEFEEEVDTLIEDGGIGVLTGEMGIGKTTALRHYLGGLEDRGVQICYHGSGRHSVTVLQELVESMGVSPARHRSFLLRQLSQRVARTYHEQRRKTVMVLDDAQLLEDQLLEDLRLLTNFDMDAGDPLILMLVGHPSLRLRLQKPIHLALWDRVRMQYKLEGLSREETAQYIDCHIRAAGGNAKSFTADAKDAIFEHAQGIPRRINDLALMLLKKSAQRKQAAIDGAFVGTMVSLMRRE